MTVIPLGRASLCGSSDLPGSCDAPSRHVSGPKSRFPPYLVLLRVGFALPVPLLERRCALTAPFHPYPSVAAQAVYFLWYFPSTGLEPSLPDVIRHTALWSSDFPPALRRATVRSGCQRFSLYSMRFDRAESWFSPRFLASMELRVAPSRIFTGVGRAAERPARGGG
jgi:hypothetical protein